MAAFDELFRKYLQGSCTQQEKQELFAMMARPEHDEALQRLISEVIDGMEDDREMNDTKAQEILSIILKAGTDKRRPGRVQKLIRGLAAAAAVLLLAGAAHYLLRPHHMAPVTTAAATTQDIPAAASGAVLTLADGRKVPLDSLGQGLIATQAGTQVTLNKGAVVYNSALAEEVAFNTLNTPRGRVFRITLPDGSGVWLNAASTLRYPTSFRGNNRTVELTGEAYFEIAPQANAPFRVKAGDHTEVLVLGTGFNVSAYPGDAQVAATLLHGKVSVNANLLQPGQQAQVQGGSVKVVQADTSRVMAWKNGIFNFENASISDVMKELERWYDIDVQYENGIPAMQFGGKIERSLSLMNIARILEISNVHCRLEGRKLIVTQ